jgi:hypothetical protein
MNHQRNKSRIQLVEEMNMAVESSTTGFFEKK